MKGGNKVNVDHERRETTDPLNFHRSPPAAPQCFIATEHAALKRYRFIYEMACGDGALVLPLRKAGYRVIASDIVDRGCPQSSVQDFLDPRFTPFPSQRHKIAAFSNPPFNRADEFIVKACEHFDYVAMILRLRYLAAKHLVDEKGCGAIQVGMPIWRMTRIPFARLIRPKSRWPTMHRDGYDGKKNNSGTIDFGIFVWEAGHVGPPQIIDEPDQRYIQTEDQQP